MKLSTTFDYNQVQFDKENEVILMTSVKAPKINLEKERAPLNLSLVLDVSGSMSGKKINMLKSTVSKLIQQLTERDTVGIVAFTDYVAEVFAPSLMTAINKNKANEEIQMLRALSATNMSGGMLKGVEQLKVSGLGKEQVHRILLFTDGQANTGLTSKFDFVNIIKSNLNDTPMTISCFGYGEDYSEDILKAIADEGKGNFYFIRNTDDIGKAFARELGGLLSCYAQNICIELEMKDSTGTFIKVLNNLDVDSKSDQHVKITFDDVYSEEEKHLLIKIKLNPVTKAVTQRTSTAVKGIIRYNDMTSGGKEKQEDISAKIKFVKTEEVQKEATLVVLEQLGFLELAEKLEQAKKYADMGNFTQAQTSLTPGVYTSLLFDRGSEIGALINGNLSEKISKVTVNNYNASVSNTLSSCVRAITKCRSVDTSSTLYVNTLQREMEEKFKVDDKIGTDKILTDNSSTFFNNYVYTLGTSTLPMESVTAGTIAENTLKKRRTC